MQYPLLERGAARPGRDRLPERRRGPDQREAGLAPAEIDVAQLYDCFAITVIVELEDLGFCPKGEGGRFVENGRLRFDGGFPATTHGGLLSAGHPGLSGGLFHVVEGVRQLRGEAGGRQVAGCETALDRPAPARDSSP